jgi:hypothetical protein
VYTAKGYQMDALRVLSKGDVVADAVMSLRMMKGGSLFVLFSVPGERIPCTFKHRYLVAPNGTVKQLPTKIIGHWTRASRKEGRL